MKSVKRYMVKGYVHPSAEEMKSIFDCRVASGRMHRGVMSPEEYCHAFWQLEGLVPDFIPDAAYKRAIVDLVCSDFPLDRQALGKYLQRAWFKKDREQRKADNRRFREQVAAAKKMRIDWLAEKENISKEE